MQVIFPCSLRGQLVITYELRKHQMGKTMSKLQENNPDPSHDPERLGQALCDWQCQLLPSRLSRPLKSWECHVLSLPEADESCRTRPALGL